MKTKVITFIVATMSFLTTQAQLKVFPNGKVGIGANLDSVSAKLSVGNRQYAPNYNISLLSSIPATGSYNIGIEGAACPNTAVTGSNYGMRGVAGNSTSGYNYGVFGKLEGSAFGAGVYGTTGNSLGTNVNGRYAGYFDGDLGVTGAAKVKLVNKYDCDNTVVHDTVSMIEALYKLVGFRGVSTTDSANHTHYGLDTDFLQQTHPEFVFTDSQGRKYANYTEIIPILITAINQLFEFFNPSQSQMLAYGNEAWEEDADRIGQLEQMSCSMSQNSPNPFSVSTVVCYTLPEETREAHIDITDMQGRPVMRVAVDPNSRSATIISDRLTSGMYLYTLRADGKDISTRRMIVNK